MRSVNNSVETINAAATAIVSAESRVQPEIPKKRWSSCWSPYWCFGSHKNGKRIGHAVLVPEPVVQGAPAAPNEPNPSTSIVMPFIAPPSSPASFLQSDPPSATQSPAGFLSLTSLSINSYSPGGPASVFSIGPYAYETQLVSPPVFSTYTTEPSTAPFTPPPESVQLTTPSSPEVPFAQLLTSSLARPRQNSGTNQKFGLSHYEFQPYQQYPGSPGGQLISPGSTFSNSGTSTPFPDRRPIIELRMGEPPKILGFEYFSTRKWGSRLGSGSLTPDGGGLGSRLGSGSLTPDGVGLVSRLGSGSLTPDGLGQDSRLGSGALTPNGMGSTTRDIIKETRISEVASLANSENVCQTTAAVIDHRVSFELTGEDVARCLANKSGVSSRIISGSSQDISAEGLVEREGIPKDTNNCCELSFGETFKVMPEKALGEGEEQCYQKHRFVSLGSIKEFNFVSTKGEISDKPTNGSHWWLTTR
ncbi:Hydroxyproline-rich glycoprotein family protein [Quillaja saponaria]|uniref:Hydroxyproline-rich glycoprotein family protein n=1 Tax=Quillaja saponaria TaxID=32244 RepID=A0AAD7PWE6_QUISA|nr:Hydroxyproline-rich glycoprotein family protein [Quillaja saponaria]